MIPAPMVTGHNSCPTDLALIFPFFQGRVWAGIQRWNRRCIDSMLIDYDSLLNSKHAQYIDIHESALDILRPW